MSSELTTVAFEVIDHGYGVRPEGGGYKASLYHLFFDTSEEAAAYIRRWTSDVRRRQCQNLGPRRWSGEALEQCWIDDRRAKPPPALPLPPSFNQLRDMITILLVEIDQELEQRKTSGNDEDWEMLQELSDQAHKLVRT
jgi:hypothetical protein